MDPRLFLAMASILANPPRPELLGQDGKRPSTASKSLRKKRKLEKRRKKKARKRRK